MTDTQTLDRKALKRAERRSKRKAFREGWNRFAQNKATVISMVVIALLLFIAIFAPLLTPYDYDAVDPLNANQSPSWAHPFGTDNIGRDMLWASC